MSSENFAIGRGKRGARAVSKEAPPSRTRKGEDSVKERSAMDGKRPTMVVLVVSRLSVSASSERSQNLSSRRCGEEKAWKTRDDGPNDGVLTTLSFFTAGNPAKSMPSMESTPIESSSSDSIEDRVCKTDKLTQPSCSRNIVRRLRRTPIFERQAGNSASSVS